MLEHIKSTYKLKNQKLKKIQYYILLILSVMDYLLLHQNETRNISYTCTESNLFEWKILWKASYPSIFLTFKLWWTFWNSNIISDLEFWSGPCKDKNRNIASSRYPKSDMTVRFSAQLSFSKLEMTWKFQQTKYRFCSIKVFRSIKASALNQGFPTN